MATRVLITDGGQRSALAAVRALGRAGIEVIVGESETPNLASRSRYCTASFQYASPFDDEEAFCASVARAAETWEVDLVVPMTDITSAVLADHQTRLEPQVRVAVNDPATFWRASDKVSLHRLADDLAIPHPTVRYACNAADLGPLDAVSFPCVLKPARSRLKTPNGWIKTTVLQPGTATELAQLVSTRPEFQHPFMLQRRIAGEGVGLFALCDRGEMRIVFAHRRLREKPPWGGVSVLREAVEPDPAAIDYSERLLRRLNWHGVAMVEFKRDESTGMLNLMEVNGRFWGSLQLAIDAGINFPLHLTRLYLGGDVPARPRYAVGGRSRWLLGDLDHVLLRLKENGTAPPGTPSMGALLLDFCRFFRRDTKLEVESISDPGPSLHEMSRYVRDLWRQ